MKKFVAVLPVFVALTACQSSQVAQPLPSQVLAVMAESQTYKCDQNTAVVAVYSEAEGHNFANLKITAPFLNLNQAAVTLKQDISASGVRYTAGHKNTLYDWHVKNPEGVLTVTHNGQEYNFVCQLV